MSTAKARISRAGASARRWSATVAWLVVESTRILVWRGVVGSMLALIGPVLQIAEGLTVDIPEDVHKTLNERTDPTWPTHWFVPRLTGENAFKDVYSVMANWGANHGSISYGHIGSDLISLASILRIPVSMHNVDGDKVFRPSAWSAFGVMEPQGADFRACQNFGPIYGQY